MQIVQVNHKRTKNLGNYESETLEIHALIEETEDPEETTKKLMKLTYDLLYPERLGDEF